MNLEQLNSQITRCDRCADLRAYCREVAREKRRAYLRWDYWGRPVPSFGDPRARILIVGLAPAAHGANRTGRMFTGDRSGDFLYAALHRAGLANQPSSIHADDGLRLQDVYITAALHCAPPANKPTPAQLKTCGGWLQRELELLQPRVIVCLGAIAWRATLNALSQCGQCLPRPLPKFGHGVQVVVGPHTIIGCYHVSQQNTFTGRLTPRMIDALFSRAKAAIAGKP